MEPALIPLSDMTVTRRAALLEQLLVAIILKNDRLLIEFDDIHMAALANYQLDVIRLDAYQSMAVAVRKKEKTHGKS